MTKMLFRPHCPGFVNDGAAAEGEQHFTTLDELREIPQVKRFLESNCTLSKAHTAPHVCIAVTEHLLMAHRDEEYYVIGYMSPDDVVWETLDLPIWEARPLEHAR